MALVFILKKKKDDFSDLSFLLSKLEKQEQTKCKAARRKEITKVKPRSLKEKTRKTLGKINETKNQFFGKVKFINL